MLKKQGFALIDGMRGIAAFAVMSLHWQSISKPWFFAPSGGLAVDLFFLLSGIVIAHAYDDRIASGELNAVRFMLIRIIRFWPLYLIGTVLGAGAAMAAIATGRVAHYQSYAEIAASTGLTLLFIPQNYGGQLFELNTPFWSLLWELVANLIFVLFWRQLSVRTLAVVVVISGAALVMAGIAHGQLSAGNLWSTVEMGPARVMFSFFLGVLIYRTVPRRSPGSFLIGPACAALLVAAFAFRPALPLPYDLFCVLVVFPALGFLVMRVDVDSISRGVFKALGDASYGVYVIHLPMLVFVSWVASHAGLSGHPAIFPLCCAALAGIVLALDHWYDRPVRKWLTEAFGLSARRQPLEPKPI